MDLTSLGFLALMIVVGGFVAYIADNLGRTLGKKRLTLFHLRPRKTATMLTVAAGMLIPLLTILVVATASREYREWLVEGHAAILRRDALAKELDGLTDQQHRLTQLNEGLKSQAVIKQAELDAKKKEVANLSKLAQDEQLKAKLLAGKLHTLQASILVVQRDLKATNLSLASTQRARDEIQQKYQVAQKDYATAKSAFFELRKQTSELNIQNASLAFQNDKLAQDVAQLGEAAKDLTEKNDKAQKDLDATKYQLDTARLNLDRAQADLKYVLDMLNYYQRVLSEDLKTSRFKRLMFGMGQELARITIPAHSTADEAKGFYRQLWQKAIVVAKAQGAKPLAGSSSPDPVGFFQRGEKQENTVPVEEQERRIMGGITGAKDDLVLIASCFANTFQDEWVPLDVKSHRNPLVYKRNDTVAEGRINGAESEEVILQQISDFMRNTVRPKALKDRMIPIQGQEEGLGEIPPAEIFRLVKEIRNADRPIRLVAKAPADIRAADPLNLLYQVR